MTYDVPLFRLFVSSTFQDFRDAGVGQENIISATQRAGERTLLQQRVFPELEKFCQENGARFQAIDLRWGVNKEASGEQKTTEICLEEVRRSRQQSPHINLMVLLGDRYGTRLLPSVIAAAEYEQLHRVVGTTTADMLKACYERDDNQLDDQYQPAPLYRLNARDVIQNRLAPRGKPFDWSGAERQMLDGLADGARSIGLPVDVQRKYWASLTELEIQESLFSPDAKHNVPLCFFRDFNGEPTSNDEPNRALYFDSDKQ